MTALERLKAKIDEWKSNYESIAKENEELKKQLQDGSSSTENCEELEAKVVGLQAEIEKLHQEIEEKDIEIESILENVEALLD
jgi:predicted RNase H-like nuclease (RuvC/YqgF family)